MSAHTNKPDAKIRCLVVDDSAFMRQLIATTLASDPAIEVVGTAPDPLIAREKIKLLNPDVVTLDIEMPKMDGIEFLRRLMTLRPTRVLMISSLTSKNADATLVALQMGAIDCLEKPLDTAAGTLATFREALLEKVRLAAAARLGTPGAAPRSRQPARPRVSASARTIIAIGASTGGVEALTHVLRSLPDGLPPIAIVQHMPPRFTESFAQRLNGLCDFEVLEAEDGVEFRPGRAVLARGGYQMEVERRGGQLRCKLFEGAPVSGHAPSVDVLFSSVARLGDAEAVGVILTGMGHDGAKGLLAMRQAGAFTLGQDRQSSLVYGMPRIAAETGAVMGQVSLDRMADAILAAIEDRTPAARQGSAPVTLPVS